MEHWMNSLRATLEAFVNTHPTLPLSSYHRPAATHRWYTANFKYSLVDDREFMKRLKRLLCARQWSTYGAQGVAKFMTHNHACWSVDNGAINTQHNNKWQRCKCTNRSKITLSNNNNNNNKNKWDSIIALLHTYGTVSMLKMGDWKRPAGKTIAFLETL